MDVTNHDSQEGKGREGAGERESARERVPSARIM